MKTLMVTITLVTLAIVGAYSSVYTGAETKVYQPVNHFYDPTGELAKLGVR